MATTTGTFTASYRTPTREELEKEILFKARVYSRMKWYESKGYVLRDIKQLCRTLEIIENL